MRKSTCFCLTLASGIGCGSVGAALAGPTYENASGGSVTFYGRINPGWVQFDDGKESNDELGDVTKSPSILGLSIIQPFNAYELKFKVETNLGIRSTDSISQYEVPDGLAWDKKKIRFVDFSLTTPGYGTFYLGQGSMATDGIADRNLGGTALASELSIGDVAGSYFLRRQDGALSNVSVGRAYANYDGGRLGRIRYDSPSFSGFVARAAIGQNILNDDDENEYWNIALAYDNKFANGIVATGGLGYSETNVDGSDLDYKDTIGSASIRLPSGLSVTLSAGTRDDHGSYGYGQIGYQGDWFAWGSTSMSLDYYKGDDMVSEGDSAKSWGVGMVQAIASRSAELYVGYREYEYEDRASDYQEAKSYMIGGRFSF